MKLSEELTAFLEVVKEAEKKHLVVSWQFQKNYQTYLYLEFKEEKK